MAVIVAAILCVILLWPLLRTRGGHVAALIAVVGVAIAVNTLVCAGISSPDPRFNTRMIWLIELAAIIAALWVGRYALVPWWRRRRARIDDRSKGIGSASA